MSQGGASSPTEPSPAEYVESVEETLASNGWDLDRTHVSKTTYLLGGTTAAADGSRKLGVIIAAAGVREQLDRSHLDYAAQAAKKYDASVVVVHARGGVPDALAERCREQGIQIIPPEDIPEPQQAGEATAPPSGGQPQRGPPQAGADQRPAESTGTSAISRRTVVGGALLGGLGVAGWTVWTGDDASDPTGSTTPSGDSSEPTNGQDDGADDDSGNADEDEEDETDGPVEITVSGNAEIAWQHQLADVESIPKPPVRIGDTVYAVWANTNQKRGEWEGAVGVSGSNGMVALGTSDGTVRWDREWDASGAQRTAGRDTSIAEVEILEQTPAILLNRGIELEALSLADGTATWTTDIATAEYNYNAVKIRNGSERLVVEGWYDSESVPLQQIVYSINPEDGDTSWQSTEEFDSDPQVGDGLVYFHKNNRIIGFDQRSGAERFSVPKDGIDVEQSVVDDGLLYLLGEVDPHLGEVRAHAISDGTEQWRFEIPFSAEELHDVGREIRVVDGTVYIQPFYRPDDNTINGTLYALDAETGTEQWRLQEEDITVGDIEIAEQTVYVSVPVRTGRDETREELWAVEMATGQRRWRFEPDSGIHKMTATDGRLYLTADDAALYGIDSTDGSEQWRAEITGDVTFGFHGEPVVGRDGAVYVSTYRLGSVVKLVETTRS